MDLQPLSIAQLIFTTPPFNTPYIYVQHFNCNNIWFRKPFFIATLFYNPCVITDPVFHDLFCTKKVMCYKQGLAKLEEDATFFHITFSFLAFSFCIILLTFYLLPLAFYLLPFTFCLFTFCLRELRTNENSFGLFFLSVFPGLVGGNFCSYFFNSRVRPGLLSMRLDCLG